MNRFAPLFGLLSLVFFIFALLSQLLIAFDDYHIIPAQLALAVFFLVLFLLKGGLAGLRSSSSRRKIRFSLGVTVYTLLFGAILVAANMWSYSNSIFRLDTTEETVFTLAPQTKEVLSTLPAEVTARAFFIGSVVPGDVASLLNRFADETRKFTWQVVDPEQNPGLTEKLGVNQNETIHFELIAGEEKRESKLVKDIDEQGIVNALLKVSRSKPRVVYFTTGHGEGDLESQSSNGFLFLKEAIEGENVVVKKLSLTQAKTIPEDADAIVALAPEKSFLSSEFTLLEEFIAKGGRIAFFLEPLSEFDGEDFFAGYGILVGNDIVVDKEVRFSGGPTMSVEPVVVDFPPHEITQDFNRAVVFSTARSILPRGDVKKGVVVRELVTTSIDSWAETNISLLLSDEPRAAIEEEDLRGPVSIALSYQQSDAEAEASSESRMLVFGDSDFVSNASIRQLFNRDFFLNSLNWVLGADSSVTVRAGTLRQSAKKLSNSQLNAMFVSTVIIIPELLLVLGVCVWWRRKNPK